jgi:hypothetical protein
MSLRQELQSVHDAFMASIFKTYEPHEIQESYENAKRIFKVALNNYDIIRDELSVQSVDNFRDSVIQFRGRKLSFAIVCPRDEYKNLKNELADDNEFLTELDTYAEKSFVFDDNGNIIEVKRPRDYKTIPYKLRPIEKDDF